LALTGVETQVLCVEQTCYVFLWIDQFQNDEVGEMDLFQISAIHQQYLKDSFTVKHKIRNCICDGPKFFVI
jgi:hypothetical protein